MRSWEDSRLYVMPLLCSIVSDLIVKMTRDICNTWQEIFHVSCMITLRTGTDQGPSNHPPLNRTVVR